MLRTLFTICIPGLFIGVLFLGCSSSKAPANHSGTAVREPDERSRKLPAELAPIRTFFKVMGKPGTSDWLGSHNEPGQTFDEYLALKPKVPTEHNPKIYILPLGTFTQRERDIVAATAGFIGEFYDLPIVQMDERPLIVNGNNSRRSPMRRGRQVRTGYILEQVLKPAFPKDAAALLAFTSEDVYGNESTNYLFGQADFDAAVGVWSLARLRENASRDVFLKRTLKIAVHETGHLFSIRHCTAYECVMSGTNHLAETDRRPLDACPEDTAKICWLYDIEPRTRYRKLAAYCSKIGLSLEAKDYERKARAVSK